MALVIEETDNVLQLSPIDWNYRVTKALDPGFVKILPSLWGAQSRLVPNYLCYRWRMIDRDQSRSGSGVVRCRFTFCPLRPGGTSGVLNLRLAVKRGVDRSHGLHDATVVPKLVSLGAGAVERTPLPHTHLSITSTFSNCLPHSCVASFVSSFPTLSGFL